MNGTLTIDIDRCVACGRCILACITAHSRAHDLAGADVLVLRHPETARLMRWFVDEMTAK
jgi:dissimilatory sulfite reductase (desulfoviridin) alpha/beta subunit